MGTTDTLQMGCPVQIVGGASRGMTGTVLQGSYWSCRGKSFRSGTLYQVQLDGVSEQSRSVRSNVVRCWDNELARFNREKDHEFNC